MANFHLQIVENRLKFQSKSYLRELVRVDRAPAVLVDVLEDLLCTHTALSSYRGTASVGLNRKPEPRAKRQWQGRPNTVSAA